MASITIKDRSGYGQVEPNHISAIRDGRVYAQLPAAASIEILEQGTFVKYDYANGEVNYTGDGPWFMVYNEEKLYDERSQMHKDYAMKKSDFYESEYATSTSKFMVPRVFGIVAGDIWTTNTIKGADTTTGVTLVEGDWLKVGSDGYLTKETVATGGTPTDGIKVVKCYTMPDGQLGVKVQATKAMS